MWHIISESPGHVLSLEKKSGLLEACPAEEIAFEIEEFFPTGRFLYWNAAFWQKKFSEISAKSPCNS
jgi:hypothetical protein